MGNARRWGCRAICCASAVAAAASARPRRPPQLLPAFRTFWLKPINPTPLLLRSGTLQGAAGSAPHDCPSGHAGRCASAKGLLSDALHAAHMSWLHVATAGSPLSGRHALGDEGRRIGSHSLSSNHGGNVGLGLAGRRQLSGSKYRQRGRLGARPPHFMMAGACQHILRDGKNAGSPILAALDAASGGSAGV